MIKNIFMLSIYLMTVVLIWGLVVTILKTPSYLLPSPIEVYIAFVTNHYLLLTNCVITVIESLFGFLLANIFSILIALMIAFNKKLEHIIVPFAVVLKTIPIIAIAPLIVIWFGSDISSKVITSALICFFPSLVNVLRGVKSLDNDLLEVFHIYSVSSVQLTEKFIFPSIAPYIFSALKVSSSLAVIGALVGEFIGANKGLGFIIIENYYSLNTSVVFAAVILSSFIGICYYYTIHFFEKKIIKWEISDI